MTMRTDERTSLRADLDRLGYQADYVDSWQPHVLMWWHKPQLNTERVVVKPVGSEAGAQPGHPDTQRRVSARGILPWPPSETCICNYCQSRDWSRGPQQPGEVFDPETFPTIASKLVNGLLPPLEGVERVRGFEKSALELVEGTRVEVGDRGTADQRPIVVPPDPLPATAPAPDVPPAPEPPVQEAEAGGTVSARKYSCPDHPDFVPAGDTPQAQSSSLRWHKKKEHAAA